MEKEKTYEWTEDSHWRLVEDMKKLMMRLQRLEQKFHTASKAWGREADALKKRVEQLERLLYKNERVG